MSAPWPPPPDLASIQELLRSADPEGFIADGAPADEYELEETRLFAAISDFSTAQMLATNIVPILDDIWQQAFSLDAAALSERRPALLSLAQEIERFFGPESRPRTRDQILQDNQSPHE